MKLMDKELVKPFIKSTISMFKDMFNFTPAIGKAYVVTNFREHNWDISGVIGIMGSHEGVFVIRLKRVLAYKLLKESRMAPESPEEITNIISGMVGEFANIICGNALNVVTNDELNITVPLTVQGTNHTIAWPIKGTVIAIPFTTPYGSFEMHINIDAS